MSTAARVTSRLQQVPWLWRGLTRVGTGVGISPPNLVLLESMSRPWWLYRSRGRLALAEVVQHVPRPVTTADIDLCERLIVAFEAATGNGRYEKARGMWAWMFNTYQQPLADALERHDPAGLARLLASMFQREFTKGLMVYADVSNSRSWLGSRILSLKSLDALVSLAEALGVVPIEAPEQRRAGLAFGGDVEELLARVDDALGFRVDFPNLGAPFGMTVDGRLSTHETPEQIYAAVRLDQATRAHLGRPPRTPLRIVEIGGGYGAMCYWYLCLNTSDVRYTIVDLPIMNVLQGYFLSNALGVDAVSLYREPDARVRIVPDSALADVESPFDALVNKDSMPEMPYDAVLGYLQWGRSACSGFFYSYNHETPLQFPDHGSGHVPAAIKQVGGFTLRRRDHSWLRRGYAEEIYRPEMAERSS